MTTHTTWRRLLAALAIVILPPVLHDAHASELERIRSESPLLNRIVTTAYDRSAAFRSLVERIEQSDVIVHLTCDHFKATALAGRTVLASARVGVRYVRVGIRCEQDDASLVAIVGHELQHVAEIAASPDAVDDRSLAHLFESIGFAVCRSVWTEQFETTAALEMGTRVRTEFLKRPVMRVPLLCRSAASAVDHRPRSTPAEIPAP